MLHARLLKIAILLASVVAAVPTAHAHTFNGYQWPGDHPRIPVRLSTTFAAGEGSLYTGPSWAVGGSLDSALNAWNNNSHGRSNARLVRLADTNVSSVANDGINVVMILDEQCPHGGKCYAAIYYHLAPNGTTMRGFDIVLYTTRGDGSPSNYDTFGATGAQTNMATTFAHELGHALGLAHDGTGGIMEPGGYGWVTGVIKDDIEGVQALYGTYVNDGFFAVDSGPMGGDPIQLELDYPSSAGLPYSVFFSLLKSNGPTLSTLHAGSACTAFDGDSRFFPLAAPFYTSAFLGPFGSGFDGFLDASGQATAQTVPINIPGLAGIPFHFSALVYEFGTAPCPYFDTVREIGQVATVAFQ